MAGRVVCNTATLVLLCILGMMAALYAYHVETTKEKDHAYKAMCDINESISCSKVFTSRFGRGFGILEYVVGKGHWMNQPNSVFGILFYIIQMLLQACSPNPCALYQVYLSIVANLGSVYLAYILYAVLEDFCVVCVTSYVINALILIVNISRYKNHTTVRRKKSD